MELNYIICSGSYYLRHTSVFETDLDKQCEKVEQYTYDEIDNIIISDVSYQGFARVNNMPEKKNFNQLSICTSG